jgi:L-ascorbate metabolism protein UlaG (beta-lactamase superfamily)
MKITYLGHAGFLMELNGKKLVFDPFISPNELANQIDVSKIQADYVLLSHGHEDHVADAATILNNNNATVVSNFEIVSWFQSKHKVEKGHPMNLGGSWSFEFGKVKYVQAVHSSMLPDGSYGGNPGGFVVESPDCNFYYAGDTALTLDMQLIGRCHRLDVAFLPIGDNFTMGVDDAILAADFIKCRKIIGMHFDTFGYVKIDHKLSVEKFKSAGIELILPEIGKPFEI